MPLLLAILLAGGVFAAEPASPPPLALTVTDQVGEVAWRPQWRLGDWNLTPFVKAGALALTENFPYPYAILKQSPYAVTGMKLTYSGAVEAMVVGTVGGINLRSQRLLDDPDLKLGSPASAHGGRDLSQRQVVESLYADVGKTFDAGAGWKGAFYAAFDQFALKSPGAQYGADGFMEGSLGTSWLYRNGPHEVSLFANVAGEAAPRNFYRNDGDLEMAPSGRGGIEYAVKGAAGRWLMGVEAQTRRADQGIRPYLGLEGRDASVLLAGEFRKSSNAFYPDSTGAALSVQTRPAKDLMLGVSARYESQRFAMAPAPVDDTKVTMDLTWTISEKAVLQSAKAWGTRKKEEYSAEKERRLNAAEKASPQRDEVKALIRASPTLNDFLKAYKPGDSMGVLTALSEFTALFSRYNYNDNEGSPPNLDSVDAIYQRARGSYLSGKDDPTLVCLGAAQYAAFMAEEMGRRAGVQIQASATTVKVADEQGRSSGHAVAAVKTQDHGIVFVDWGRLIPTYTFDTERAFRVYQALVGVPAMFHQITDPNQNGRHVGYMFTEEGKLYVNNLTFHGETAKPPLGKLFEDDPRGDEVAKQRYKDLLRRGSP
ncbi:MAG: hypothetical protein AAB320_06595 [Elusimicrobiota bacterium]